MQYLLCRHIKTNGVQCKSPALSNADLCFFHARLHRRHAAFQHTDATRGYLIPGQHIELAPLEDRESVQLALSIVINALATGRLDSKRATAILYGLQLASNNAARLKISPFPYDVVQTVTPADGLDLAEPGLLGHATHPDEFIDEPDPEDLEDAEEEQEDREFETWLEEQRQSTHTRENQAQETQTQDTQTQVAPTPEVSSTQETPETHHQP